MSDKRKASGEEGNLHVGHRKRMLERFQKNGLDAFSDVETLEFLLGYALARIDTNVIAHRLLNRFGNLSRVFDAPVELLTQVEGVGLRTASLIRLCAALWNRTEEVRLSNERYLRTTSEVGQYLVAKIGAYREERAFLLCLDNSCKEALTSSTCLSEKSWKCLWHTTPLRSCFRTTMSAPPPSPRSRISTIRGKRRRF